MPKYSSEVLKELSDLRRDAYAHFNRTVLSLSASLLALTVTFWTRLVNDKSAHPELLIVSAAMFFVCLICGTVYLLRDIYLSEDASVAYHANPNVPAVKPRWFFRFVERVLPIIFIAALIAFFVYNVYNISWEPIKFDWFDFTKPK